MGSPGWVGVGVRLAVVVWRRPSVAGLKSPSERSLAVSREGKQDVSRRRQLSRRRVSQEVVPTAGTPAAATTRRHFIEATPRP